MRNLLLAAMFAVLVPVAAMAQTMPDSYQLKYYAAGAAAPLQQTDAFLSGAANCNAEPPQVQPTELTVNPSVAVWDDPVNAGKVCIYAFPQNGALFSLPIGQTFQATMVGINSAGASAESARSNPFSRLGPPPAPTGLLFVR